MTQWPSAIVGNFMIGFSVLELNIALKIIDSKINEVKYRIILEIKISSLQQIRE